MLHLSKEYLRHDFVSDDSPNRLVLLCAEQFARSRLCLVEDVPYARTETRAIAETPDQDSLRSRIPRVKGLARVIPESDEQKENAPTGEKETKGIERAEKQETENSEACHRSEDFTEFTAGSATKLAGQGKVDGTPDNRIENKAQREEPVESGLEAAEHE